MATSLERKKGAVLPALAPGLRGEGANPLLLGSHTRGIALGKVPAPGWGVLVGPGGEVDPAVGLLGRVPRWADEGHSL